MSEEQKQDTTPGRFCWNELATSDVEGAIKFYTDVFGWTAEKMEMDSSMEYYCMMDGETPVAGLMPIVEEMGPVPPHWASYVSVENLEASIEKATAGGGTVLAGPVDIPGKGRFSVIKDPQGAVFSFWQYVCES